MGDGYAAYAEEQQRDYCGQRRSGRNDDYQKAHDADADNLCRGVLQPCRKPCQRMSHILQELFSVLRIAVFS